MSELANCYRDKLRYMHEQNRELRQKIAQLEIANKELRERNKSARDIIKYSEPLIKHSIDDNGRPGYFNEASNQMYKKATDWLKENNN